MNNLEGSSRMKKSFCAWLALLLIFLCGCTAADPPYSSVDPIIYETSNVTDNIPTDSSSPQISPSSLPTKLTYDKNSDGILDVTEFPVPEAKIFGITGEFEVVYDAVAQYMAKNLPTWFGSDYPDLLLLDLKIYAKFEDPEHNINYVCDKKLFDFLDLGLNAYQLPETDPNLRISGEMWDFCRITLNRDGVFLELKTIDDGLSDAEYEEQVRDICGPHEDLVNAWLLVSYQKIEEIPYDPIFQTPPSREMLADYINYFF